MKYHPNAFLKAVTLFLFVFLLSAFVAYRAGVFSFPGSDAPVGYQGRSNAALVSKMALDTLPPGDSLLPVKEEPEEPYIMPSSKSGPIGKQFKMKPLSDSITEERRMLSSSKSGLIFEEKDVKSLESKDSSAIVPAKRKKSSKKNRGQ